MMCFTLAVKLCVFSDQNQMRMWQVWNLHDTVRYLMVVSWSVCFHCDSLYRLVMLCSYDHAWKWIRIFRGYSSACFWVVCLCFRHPVRYCHFDERELVVGHVPYVKQHYNMYDFDTGLHQRYGLKHNDTSNGGHFYSAARVGTPRFTKINTNVYIQPEK